MDTIESLWQRPLQAALCEVCDWRYLLPLASQATTCPHCYQAALTPLAGADLAAIGAADQGLGLQPDSAPELVLPFKVAQERVATEVGRFARSFRFSPRDLSATNLQSRLRPLYLPSWLVDSDVAATWQAEVGFDYQVVSHHDSYRGDTWHTSEVEETKVRWEARVGRLQRHYNNIRAPALEESRALRQRLGQYNLDGASPYQPGLIDGALIRLPNRDRADAWPDAVPQLRQLATEECRQAARADHIREFKWRVAYDGQHWSLLLLPLYSTWYLDDDGQPVPVLLHGRTGQLTGVKRASMKRAWTYTRNLTLLATLFFVITALLLWLQPSLVVLFGLITLVLGVTAVLPVAYASQFNRRQRSDLIFTRVGRR